MNRKERYDIERRHRAAGPAANHIDQAVGRIWAGHYADDVLRLLDALDASEAENERLTDLHKRIASQDDVAAAYQAVYFEDFPLVRDAMAAKILAEARAVAAETLLAEAAAVIESGFTAEGTVGEWEQRARAWLARVGSVTPPKEN